MKISVIIAAYNSFSTLPRALDSVLKQVYPAHEIIVVDDGSTDTTYKIKEQFQEIIYITQANSGPSSARNKGSSVSTGEFLTFLDADDYWHPDHLSNLVGLIIKNNYLKWAASAYFKYSADGNMTLFCLPSKYFKRGLVNDYFVATRSFHFVSTISLLIRKDLFLEAGGFPVKYSRGEDLSLWLRLALIEPQLGYSEIPTAYYTYSGNSLTNKRSDLNRLFQRISDDYIFCSGFPENLQKKAWMVIKRWVRGLLIKAFRERNKVLLNDILMTFNKRLDVFTRLVIRGFLLFNRI